MNRKGISVNVSRKLWAESMGHCMNPSCSMNLFSNDGKSIGEMAHIKPHSQTADDSFENLILLCRNCHIKYDQEEEEEEERERKAQSWKQKASENIQALKIEKYSSFQEMEKAVKPILEHNKLIFSNYYINQESSHMWEKFEPKLITNNEKLKLIFESNIGLFQGTKNSDSYDDDNHSLVQEFILHVEEFRDTRNDDKIRHVFFPEKINSIFGIDPACGVLTSNVSALQEFILKLKHENRFISLDLIHEPPKICYLDETKQRITLGLNDSPRVRQLFWSTYSYGNKNSALRLESLIFFLRWLNNNKFTFSFHKEEDLSSLVINSKHHIKIVYEYCLSTEYLKSIASSHELIIVNLHNFNGDGCISSEAYSLAKNMSVKLSTTTDFYRYARKNLKL